MDGVKLRMFVLVSAATVLVTSAIPSTASHGNLNAIFDLANKVNQSFITVRAVFLFVLHFLRVVRGTPHETFFLSRCRRSLWKTCRI